MSELAALPNCQGWLPVDSENYELAILALCKSPPDSISVDRSPSLKINEAKWWLLRPKKARLLLSGKPEVGPGGGLQAYGT